MVDHRTIPSQEVAGETVRTPQPQYIAWHQDPGGNFGVDLETQSQPNSTSRRERQRLLTEKFALTGGNCEDNNHQREILVDIEQARNLPHVCRFHPAIRDQVVTKSCKRGPFFATTSCVRYNGRSCLRPLRQDFRRDMGSKSRLGEVGGDRSRLYRWRSQMTG